MKLTIKQLAVQANISEGTIRAWCMKPTQGQVYSSDTINYANLREKLHKYYEDENEFEQLVGCKIIDVEIIKTERVAKRWVTIDELEINNVYTIYNYSLKTAVQFKGIFGENIYIFVTNDNSVKAYWREQLTKDNIKIEFNQA